MRKDIILVCLSMVLIVGIVGMVQEQGEAKDSVVLPEGISANWWTMAQENIRRSEYQVNWKQTPLPGIPFVPQAFNRPQNFRIYFTPTGIRMTPRTTEDHAWEWGMTLTGYGYEGTMQPVSAPVMAVAENRVEYHWETPSTSSGHGIIEWYLNDECGLEQGFTLTAPPDSQPFDSHSQVVLELDVSGGLLPYVTDDGTALEFRTSDGVTVLHYAQLYAYDAAGRQLSAQLSLPAPQTTVRILVDATDARYPITIDPLVTSPDWTVEGDQANAYLGFSVGTAGDVNGDGYADIIVGAFGYANGGTNEGRVYVYHGSATGLSTTADWMTESDQDRACFGFSVGTAGDVNGDGYADIIVGAPYYDNGETNEGRVFVYHGSATGLSTSPAWMVESDQTRAEFGCSVGTAGDVNSDGYADVIVGAPQQHDSNEKGGWAFVYHGSATGLSISPAWTVESDQAGAEFGWSVGTTGDVNNDGYSDVIVGAWYYDGGEKDEGRVFVYHGSATGLSISPTWTAESDQTFAYFGISVGTTGDVNNDGYADVIVGANHYDNGETNEGRVFVYHGSATGLSTSPVWTAESDQEHAYFGRSVGTAGDVNNDGYADVIVGADVYTNDETREGRVFIYHGSATGLSPTAAWMVESDCANAFFGRSVGTAGDVNDDGYADVIVGADRYDNGEDDEGRAFVYYGVVSAEPINILSDNTWKSYDSLQAGWETLGFDDSNWRDAYAPYPFDPGYPPDSWIPGTEAVYMWDWPYSGTPTTGMNGPIEAWFRKSFTLSCSLSDIESAQITLNADDYFDLYVNGVSVVTAAMLEGGPYTVDIKPYLQEGENVLAIHAWDGYSPGQPQNRLSEWVLVDATISLNGQSGPDINVSFDPAGRTQIPGINPYTTTGARMDGMVVIADFSDGTAEARLWTDADPDSGGVFGTGWSLTENDDTFSGIWTLTRDYSHQDRDLTRIWIDALTGGSVFDTGSVGEYGIEYDVNLVGEHGTDGSALGWTFDMPSAPYNIDIEVTYSDMVALSGHDPVGDIYRYLEIEFTNPGGFAAGDTLTFIADTDKVIPEPSTMLLLGSGLIGTLALLRKRLRG